MLGHAGVGVSVGALVATALAAAMLAPAAWATFPGRNGALIVARSHDTPRFGLLSSRVEAVNPRSKRRRRLFECAAAVPPSPCMFEVARASPDGLRLALAVDFAGASRLVTVGLDGGEERVFPKPAAVGGAADVRGWGVKWAPPGERLLAPGPTTTGVPGNLAFFGPDGAITPGPALAVVPDPYGVNATQPTSGGEGFDLSADGELAAGVYTRGCVVPPGGKEVICTSSDIFVGARRVTYRGGESPSWSPHGQSIAFTRNTRRVSALKDPDVFVMRRDGSRLRRLTHLGGGMPAWSPDGRQIAFVRDGSLYSVSPRGGQLRRYGRYGSKDNFPWFVTSLDWQVRPR